MKDDPLADLLRLREAALARMAADRAAMRANYALPLPSGERWSLLRRLPADAATLVRSHVAGGAVLAGAALGIPLARHAARNSDAPRVGEALARRVADRLVADARGRETPDGSALAYLHRYHCGQGLFYGWTGTTEFWVAEVEDGWPTYPPLRRFDTADAFVGWLALQTDRSLSGATDPTITAFKLDNQRLTLARLRAYADGEP
ncbi:hypothetical protein JQC91_07850 [Jannaschia sp. Os4]|uniref:hypothetical protein n=1 Tax=Jannaschia sp. Os4 TaxID=2807617 RepID=UPI001939B59E|nr:hypothetical protein [Jannaschia sp. Os4]MBM2576216.1 hypothetical protein [Jannaschia sp. Os4]